MEGNDKSAVLAIDGGGTGSRLAIENAGDRVAVEAGPANVFTDFDAACASLTDGLRRLAGAAGLPVAEVSSLPACVALAGVIDEAIARRVREAVGFSNARVEDDRPASVEGALGARDGAVAALGTGSFFALKTGGEIKFAGGWGAQVDDRASAFWIGREALAATLEAADGVGPPSPLTDRLLSRFGTPPAIAAFAARAAQREVALIAREVDAAARQGDIVAHDILTRAAAHVLRTVAALGAPPDMALCFTGGAAAAVAAVLPDDTKARLIHPEGTALDGALARARRLRDGTLP